MIKILSLILFLFIGINSLKAQCEFPRETLKESLNAQCEQLSLQTLETLFYFPSQKKSKILELGFKVLDKQYHCAEEACFFKCRTFLKNLGRDGDIQSLRISNSPNYVFFTTADRDNYCTIKNLVEKSPDYKPYKKTDFEHVEIYYEHKNYLISFLYFNGYYMIGFEHK